MKQLARGNRLEAGGWRVEAVSPKPYGLKPTYYSLQPIAAASRFGRYGPLVSREVRQPDVTGQSYFEQVKRTREMLRSTDPETVKQVIEFTGRMNFFEALALAKKEGKLIVPNFVHDRILTETGEHKYFRQNYLGVLTGTLVIYEKPDVPFGEQVIFEGVTFKVVTFKVPKQFRGKINCALVVEHPDFELIDLGNNRFEIRATDGIHLIEQFPKQDGWHMPDAETGIPRGKAVKESSDARYLWRLKDSSYLGPVAREYGLGYDYRRVVDLYRWSSNGSGVALVPLATAPKKSDSHG